MTDDKRTRIYVGSELNYDVRQPTTFLFKIAAARTDHQALTHDELLFTPSLDVDNCQVGPDGNRMQRVVVQPGNLTVSYQATVELTPDVHQPGNIDEADVSSMPPEVLTYLNPSRYCQSDLLGRFAFEECSSMPRGFARVQAISDWVYHHLEYTPGSTGPTTTASDVLLQRAGICRDFAHLMITMCRGVGIPARYVSGYAVNLQPQDYHGFVEAFLDGHWYLFDPTRLASTQSLVRIGVGRDAADVAFATLTGSAVLQSKSVWANFDQSAPTATDAAISTA